MQADTLLLNRNSHPKLAGELPDTDTLEFIYQAALRAPDHGCIRPWRFIEFSGAGRERLGEIFFRGLMARNPQADEAQQNKVRMMTLRAPLIIAVIAKVTEDHPKVPVIEQVLSAGAAAQNMVLAAYAKNLGAIWRTGDVAFDPVVNQELGLEGEDQIVGYLYIGDVEGRNKPLPEHNTEDFVERWS